MKASIIICCVIFSIISQAQSIVGTWQLTDEKSCIQSDLKESDTEKELLKDMQSSENAVARTIRFDKKGRGEDGVFSEGKKKGTDRKSINYSVNGGTLALLDPKSGIMTQQWIIDEMTVSTLKIHNAKRVCEVKSFARIK